MSALPTTILFATDGTPASHRARGAAAHLAHASRATLHVVHVWSPAPQISAAHGVDQGIASAVATSEAHVLEEELDCVVTRVHTPHGSRAHGILLIASTIGADLIVVGGRHLSVVEELFTYRVSEDVIHHSPRPVLLVRQDGQSWPPRHVVVGCDHSAEATRAATLAAWIARLAGAELLLVAVVHPGGEGRREDPSEAMRRLEALAAGFRVERGAAAVAIRVVTSSDVPAALREACTFPDPTLLAIGARGSSVLHRVPLFSVSRSIIHHTHLPLLLVPQASGL